MAATLSSVLTYCTNVHPGDTLAEVKRSLERWTVPLCRILAREGWETSPFPLGLYLSASAITELEQPGELESFRAFLAERSFSVATLNCFPYGGFHDESVKRRVYQPSWLEPQRADYSIRAARVLSALIPEGSAAAISTLSGTFKKWAHDPDTLRAIARALLLVSVELDRLRAELGRDIVLSLEPEPLTSLETTDEAVDFFKSFLFSEQARRDLVVPRVTEEVVRRHLAVCYDTCHQAVEFEDVTDSLRRLCGGGIRVGKMQISSAIALKKPAADPKALEELSRYAEPRYLHQTVARLSGGEQRMFEDLPEFLSLPPLEMKRVEEVRTHFHVPIDRPVLGPLGTTRDSWREAVSEAVRRRLTQTFEVETYTFPVLPGVDAERSESWLPEALARELCAARDELAPRGGDSSPPHG